MPHPILLPRRSQPRQIAKPRHDWCAAWNYGAGLTDAAGAAGMMYPPPAGGRLAGQGGLGLKFTAYDVTTRSAALAPGLGSNITAVMIVEPSASTASSNFMFGEAQPGVGAYNWGLYDDSSGGVRAYVHTTSGVSASDTAGYLWADFKQVYVYVMTYDGATISLYRDGELRGTAAQSGAIQRNASATLGICVWNAPGISAIVYCCAVSARCFSAGEIRARLARPEVAWHEIFGPEQIHAPEVSVSAVPSITAVSAENITATSADYRVTLDFA